MKIAVAKEIDPGEPRVAASPDTVKKLKALGVDIAIEPGAGVKSGVPDSEFTAAGADRQRRCAEGCRHRPQGEASGGGRACATTSAARW